MKSPVITEIVENDLCIGCGICSALCTEGVLEMKWNQYGEYNPIEVIPCTKECQLCLKVCPFANHEDNEDTLGKKLFGKILGINYNPETGYHLTTSVGYSEKHRPISASGGMATWLLEKLLVDEIVDYVICVTPTGDPDKLFAYGIFDTAESVRNGAGSAYYPVELSAVIRHILETPGRYAVTGLPCFTKAIRLAQQRNANLRERIVVCVGLNCGQMKSKHFTDYIAAIAGVQGKVTAVRYRGKSPDHPANNYHYVFKTVDGVEKRIFLNEGIADAWTNCWFTPKACSYCDDIFAECADVTFMDAWLPEYSKDYRGTNLIVVRSPLIQDLISRDVQEKKIHLDPIPIQVVIRSQAEVVDFKRRNLAYRLYLNQKKGKEVPKKRVGAERPDNFIERLDVAMNDKIQESVRSQWIINPSVKYLNDITWFTRKLVAYRKRLTYLTSLPKKIFSRIFRIIPTSAISYQVIRFLSQTATVLENAAEPLNIPTYDGSNQVVHPSVIDFLEEYGLPQWGGYRFWMVITPYPYANDTYENPSVYTSNDGITWVVPPHIINPVNNAPGGWERGFNNDPDMVYDPDLDEIRVYFRFASTDQLKVKLIKIKKDYSISEPITVMSQSPWDQSDNTHRSLCIWRESSHRWHMWGGGGTKIPPYNIYYRFSEDGIHWNLLERCVNEEGIDPIQALGYSNWHISCKPNNRENRIEFLSFANPISSKGKGVILYAECNMKNPTLIRTPLTDPILLPSKRGWDNGTLYRCSFSISEIGNSYHYRIWYSAASKKNIWKLGLTDGCIGTGHSNFSKSTNN
jgi:coenzyme F420-reducing hydrogenase beta subunit